jgi:lipoprotein signal peptidase
VVPRETRIPENAIMMPSRTRPRSAWLGFTVIVAITFTLASAGTLQAQVLSDPRVAEFDPSPDHFVVLDSGDSAVLRYELDVFPVGSSTAVGKVDMGKPSPDGDGKIRFDFSTQVTSWSLPGGNYEARVTAIGPQGEAASDPSNPFTFSTSSTCDFSLSSSTVPAAASGGSYGVDVTTGSGCAWVVTNALPWVNLWTGGGSGTGTAAFEVYANTSGSSRTGTIAVAGKTVTVSQPSAPPCTYSLSPGSATVAAGGGSASFVVTAGSGCAWTAATSSPGWISIVGGSGSGNGTVSLGVSANSSTSSRTGTASVQGQTFSVTQVGAAPTCTYSMSPGSASLPAAGGSTSFSVTAGSGCAWTAATSSPSWISIVGGSGSGSGIVSLSVMSNSSTSSRTGTVTVQGRTFTVTQAGAAPSCSYSLSPGSASVPAGGGSASFAVTANSGCAWTATTADTSWITITSGSGAGNGTASVTVTPNTSAAIREGTVTVQGQTFIVSQPGAPSTCSYSVSPTSANVPAAGGNGQVSVTTGSGCAWGVLSSAGWLMPSATGGSGGGGFTYTARSNSSMWTRSATLTIGPWVVTVTQSGKSSRTK